MSWALTVQSIWSGQVKRILALLFLLAFAPVQLFAVGGGG